MSDEVRLLSSTCDRAVSWIEVESISSIKVVLMHGGLDTSPHITNVVGYHDPEIVLLVRNIVDRDLLVGNRVDW